MSVFVRVYTVTWYSGRYKFSGFLRLRKWMKIIPTVSSNIYNNCKRRQTLKGKNLTSGFISANNRAETVYTHFFAVLHPRLYDHVSAMCIELTSCIYEPDVPLETGRCVHQSTLIRSSWKRVAYANYDKSLLWTPPQHLPSVNKMAQVHFKWLLGNTDLYLTAQWWFVCVGHGLKSSGRACLTLWPSSPASQL